MIFQDLHRDASEHRATVKNTRNTAKKKGLKYYIRFPTLFDIEYREETFSLLRPHRAENILNSRGITKELGTQGSGNTQKQRLLLFAIMLPV